MSKSVMSTNRLLDAMRAVGLKDEERAAWLCCFADRVQPQKTPYPPNLGAETAVFATDAGRSGRQLEKEVFDDKQVTECHVIADTHLRDLVTGKQTTFQLPRHYATITVTDEESAEPHPRWAAVKGVESFVVALYFTLKATASLLGQCPNCHKRFVGTKQGQKFCSRPCANRYSVRQWREAKQQ